MKMNPAEINDIFWVILWAKCMTFAVMKAIVSLAMYYMEKAKGKKK